MKLMFRIIHAEGYSPTDLMSKRDVVYHNLFNGIREAIKEAQNQNLPLEEELMVRKTYKNRFSHVCIFGIQKPVAHVTIP